MSRCAVHGTALPCVACRAKRTNVGRPAIPPEAAFSFPPEAAFSFPADDPEPSPEAPQPKAFDPKVMVEREVAARELHANALLLLARAVAVYVEHTTGRKVINQ